MLFRSQELEQIQPLDLVSVDCPGDTDGDLVVGLSDLLTVLSGFGDVTGDGAPAGDLDGSGVVGLEDLLEVLGAFGDECG